ncbi:GIP [Symbiodinium sp. CCMP2456]|nr:GIP [Symbiodinium sp. CCMP2456]
MSDKDPFKDLVFNGAPSEYRLFRRKILLSVASLEEKHVYLAGPRILNRLTGEAWRATEHLAIGDLRSEKGWLRVLQALDEHYRYLPETELNECVDEFLFHLKRKGHEGPTAFVSRFKAVLSRLETLVAAEKAQQKGSTKRRRSSKRTPSPDGEPSTSSLSSDHAEDEEPVLTKDRVEAAAAAAETPSGARAPAEPASVSKGPRTVGSFVESPKKKPPSAGGSQKSRGTQKADDERANRQMMEDLGKLEVGHLRVKPIFPEVILGHLFMRKYGLNREQRSQVIRSTGGSCRFRDVEKVIRASDYEDKFHDPSSRVQSSRSTSGANVLAAEEGSSLSEPTYSDEDEVNEAATGDEENDDDEDLEEAYEIQKKAKNDAKRAFRSYKDSRRRVKEIRKDRQPYMPVVAIPPSSSNAVPPDALPVQPTFRYDRKPSRRTNDKGKGGRKGRKEDVSLVQASLVTEFSYMVSAEDAAPEDDQEIFAVSVPPGLAVIDTGCTTSVIGRRTADRYIEFFKARNIPEPTLVTLPPVQLKGFNGMRSSSDRGLKWTVKLGSLWGQVTTYLVEGEAPFLLSRKVLQSMEATIDLGKCTLSSENHGLKNEPLAQASNGHLLMPLVPTEDYEDLLQVQLAETPVDKAAGVDKRKHFQTIMKHTRYTQVDTGTYRYELRMVFGQDVDFALCAYRRAVFDRPGACLFAYRYATAQEQAVFAGPASLSHHCERGRGLASIRLGVSFGQDFNKAKVSLAKGGEAARSVLARRKKVVSALQSCHCPGHQSHAHVSEKPRDHGGRYPPKFCKKLVRALASRDKEVLPEHDIFMQTDDEADSERESDQEGDPDEEPRLQAANRRSYAAMIQKLHVNTGHASVPQMLRLAQRAKAPADLIAEIRKFKRSVCEELQVPPTHRVAALQHTETPNHIVGLDLVQVELKKEGPRGPIETKYNVLTAVDYASDFAQQIVLPAGPGVARSQLEPMAHDELKSMVSGCVANGQLEVLLAEIDAQRPDKMVRRNGPGSDSGLSDYAVVNSPPSPAVEARSAPSGPRNGPPVPCPVNQPIRNGPPVPCPVNHPAYADGDRRRAPAAPSSPASSLHFDTSSETETTSSYQVEHGYEEEYKLPRVTSHRLPHGLSSLQQWGRSLLTLPKFAEKKWSYKKILEVGWNDKDVLSYLRWIRSTYYQDASRPVPGKASDLAAFLIATDYPIMARLGQVGPTRVFVDE